MENNILKNLTEVLEKDERFISDEWDLLKNTIREKAENLDENLISLLLDNETLREKFFIKIKDVIVFDNNKFIKFINNKEFLPNSYTSFKNKIGLTNERWDFIAFSNEVVLNFPFKDCVLAWWQDKEDQKRDEIFYNEILGQDDIDRLFDKKVFTNFKRIDKDWEHELEEFKRDKNWDIKDNLIIKWNNLLALHSLKLNFAGKVKLIYIDPPYNTSDDSFKYNDKFNHSTWLTFMKNRLEVAKNLLKGDWVIFVQCDDNEQAYLKVLMDEIFWREKFINCITVKMSESKWLKNAHIEKKMPKNKEYILIYQKKQDNFLFNPEKIEKEGDELLWYVKYYNKFIPNINDNINDWKIENYKLKNLSDKLNDKDKLIYLVKPDNEIKYDILINNSFFKITNSKWKDNYFFYNGEEILKVLFLWENTSKFLWDLWLDISTININKESWVETLNNWQKPEKLIQRIINLATQPWDLVLDYHLWSWTTCAVAHKMWRQYIWIEQMDYIETISCERMKKVIEWEQWWISKNVEWKGWWDFVYMELMQENHKIIENLEKAKNISDLREIYENIKNNDFINYKINPENFDLKNISEEDFEDFRKFLLEIIDKNLLYKNFSEINDKNNEITDKEKNLNNNFYNN